MGVLRLLLAISVIFGHVSFTALFTGPVAAVQAFYIISGFYIAMVLDTTTAYRSKMTFYINRYLRLFPIYVAVALIALAVKLILDPSAAGRFMALPIVAQTLLVVSNATLFFQDWVMFFGIDHGHLAILRDVKAEMPYPLYHFLLIPPSWSLGCELTFYLLAPFLAKLSNRSIGLLIGISLALRLIGARAGLVNDPWSYRFFPFEVATFCLGIVSYRLYARFKPMAWFNNRNVRLAVIVVLFAITVFFTRLHFAGLRPIYLLLVCTAVPILFHATKRIGWDRYIGELSYPMYITHQLVLKMWLALPWCRRVCGEGIPLSVIICLCAAGASLLLNRFVQKPFEKLRSRWKSDSNAFERVEERLNVPIVAE